MASTNGNLPEDEIRVLIDFGDRASTTRWHAVDDRVMGGVSTSRLESTDAGTALFSGELSLEGGGGFTSVRSAVEPRDIAAASGIALRARGDGRVYRFRVRTSEAPDAPSHLAPFQPPAEWSTVRIPFGAFAPSLRGRALPDAPPLDPRSITGFGLLLSGARPGPFALELAWIGAYG